MLCVMQYHTIVTAAQCGPTEISHAHCIASYKTMDRQTDKSRALFISSKAMHICNLTKLLSLQCQVTSLVSF